MCHIIYMTIFCGVPLSNDVPETSFRIMKCVRMIKIEISFQNFIFKAATYCHHEMYTICSL